MESVQNLYLLGLTPKERRVLLALQEGQNTPLLLSRATHISRPAIYAILTNLKKRGLVNSRITNGKKHWQLESEQKIEEVLYETKRVLLRIPQGREEIHGLSDSTVIVHRGLEAVKTVMINMLGEHKHEHFYGWQGNVSAIGWNKTFTAAETNKFNRDIKSNHVITDALVPNGWFEEQTRVMGIKWAEDFEGRTTRVNVLDPKYFKNAAQIWVFRRSLYLLALNEELIIEIRNSEIQKCILAIFEFMQENSRTIDANELLRKLIARAPASKDAGGQ